MNSSNLDTKEAHFAWRHALNVSSIPTGALSCAPHVAVALALGACGRNWLACSRLMSRLSHASAAVSIGSPMPATCGCDVAAPGERVSPLSQAGVCLGPSQRQAAGVAAGVLYRRAVWGASEFQQHSVTLRRFSLTLPDAFAAESLEVGQAPTFVMLLDHLEAQSQLENVTQSCLMLRRRRDLRAGAGADNEGGAGHRR